MPKYPGTRYAQILAQRGQQGEPQEAPPLQWGQSYRMLDQINRRPVPAPRAAEPAAPSGPVGPPEYGPETRRWLKQKPYQQPMAQLKARPLMQAGPQLLAEDRLGPRSIGSLPYRPTITSDFGPGGTNAVDEYKQQQRRRPRFTNQY